MYIKGKRARLFVNQYNKIFYPLTLDDVYKSYSHAKHCAWLSCELECERLNGRRLTVLSYNTFFFTAAFEYTHPDTGVLMLHVETYADSYDMEMWGAI